MVTEYVLVWFGCCSSIVTVEPSTPKSFFDSSYMLLPIEIEGIQRKVEAQKGTSKENKTNQVPLNQLHIQLANTIVSKQHHHTSIPTDIKSSTRCVCHCDSQHIKLTLRSKAVDADETIALLHHPHSLCRPIFYKRPDRKVLPYQLEVCSSVCMERIHE